MAASMKSLGIDQWSPEERLKLLDELLQSLQEVPLDLLPPGQLQELRECIEEDDRDPSGGEPWEEVRAELLAELEANANRHHFQGQAAHSSGDTMV